MRIAPAVSAFSRDFRTGARVDGLTGVCAFSRDKASDAQVCIDGRSDEWEFGEFPKVDTDATNTVKARVNGIKLSNLCYIDVDVEGQQCTGLVDSGAEICLISEGLVREIHADECGHIDVRGIFCDHIRLHSSV